LTRTTIILGVLFFATSMSLTLLTLGTRQTNSILTLPGQTAPANPNAPPGAPPTIPSLPTAPAAPGGAAPPAPAAGAPAAPATPRPPAPAAPVGLPPAKGSGLCLRHNSVEDRAKSLEQGNRFGHGAIPWGGLFLLPAAWFPRSERVWHRRL